MQPNGDADFCVDFPDNRVGNVREATIDEMEHRFDSLILFSAASSRA